MKAVVMAGGEGSRLRPLTIQRPKPMVPIVNKPVMEHVLDLLKKHGITDVVVTVQYLASVIQKHFGDGSSFGMKITYSVEETPLGTAGSVKNAEAELQEPFLVISADALTDFDLEAIIRFHTRKKSKATLTLYRVPNPLEYGVIIIDEEGNIRQFLEKPSWGEVFSDTVNTGIYMLDPSVFDYIPPGKSVDFSQDVFPAMLRKGDALFGYVASGYWCDVGNIPEYMRANADALNGKVNLASIGEHVGGGVFIEDEVEIAPDAALYGPVFLGRGCKIKGGVVVHGPSVIRDYAIIDSHAHVDRSVVWRNSYIGERAEIRGAIVCRQCSIKNRVLIFEGAVIADGTVVNDGAIVQPQVKIWPNKEIETGATISSSIIWGHQGRRALFGRWGITGLVNVDITPEFGARLGAAYGAILKMGSKVTMNRDPHRMPRMIKRAMISGLPSAGVNVVDIKSLPLPVARYVTRVTDAVGGVHVRLSPYDNRVVDIKFFDSRGLDIDKTTERKIENTYFREDYRRAYLDEVGLISEATQIGELYTRDFLQTIDVEKVRRCADQCSLVIDYAHSTSSQVLPPLLNDLGLNVVALNGSVDETRLARTPEEFEAGMRQLAVICEGLHTTMGARLDVGGEKVFLTTGRGEVVPGWRALGAVADLLLRGSSGGVLAVPVTAPNLFERLAARHGGSVVRTRANWQALMSIAASRGDILLAGDGEGGVIFPRFQPVMDGLFTVVKIMELLASHGVRLEDVVDLVPPYYMARTRVPCPWEVKGQVMRMLNEQYRGRGVHQIDGVRIEMGEEWVLVLPDVDRPLFHVIAESTSQEGARTLMDKYAALVDSLQR
ncbi:MAG: mannose-1-phosphate guanyltransferase [Dehalococcoidales bacterium]|nr:mannose-1-phosphate guanyltransferase [Dehalococcoidales bacterium]